MSTQGFTIDGLRLRGDGVPAAELTFARGLTVISGVSDTGKTFAVECIDFMLGKERVRDIPEAHGYAEALLGVAPRAGVAVTLRRPLAGGRFRLVEAPLASAEATPSSVQLGEKHAKNQRNISSFLLDLCGLNNKNVRVSASGKVRRLSFRNVAPLVIVQETPIFKPTSMFLSGQYTERVAETSVFRLLLTGEDAAAPSAPPDVKLQKARQGAQVALLDEFIAQAEADLRRIGAPDDPSSALDAVREDATRLASVETSMRDEVTRLEEVREQGWRRRESAHARLQNIVGLLTRFDVLREQYASDRDRLGALAEAGQFFGQLPAQRCPLCGAEASADHPEHSTSGEAIALAATREVEKIQVRLRELGATMEFLSAERERESTQHSAADAEIRRINDVLDRSHQPRLRALVADAVRLEVRRAELERAIQLRTQIDSLKGMRTARSGKPAAVATDSGAPLASLPDMSALCAIMSELLTVWRFPGGCSVQFDDLTQDFRVSGKLRASYGKGLRAITHAAFSIGLLLHARRRAIPHPGFVLLDSPLVTYRKPDVPTGEGIGDDVKDAFYEDLAKRLGGEQVLVFENELPPTRIKSGLRHEHFTGNVSLPRTAFIPPRS